VQKDIFGPLLILFRMARYVDICLLHSHKSYFLNKILCTKQVQISGHKIYTDKIGKKTEFS